METRINPKVYKTLDGGIAANGGIGSEAKIELQGRDIVSGSLCQPVKNAVANGARKSMQANAMLYSNTVFNPNASCIIKDRSNSGAIA